MALKFMTAEEAAQFVNDGDIVGFSGFTPAGTPKAVTVEIAKRAEEAHAQGKPFQIGMYTGASTGGSIDGVLAKANAIKFRTPYQSNKDLRNSINAQQAQYFDMHLSHLAQELRYGFMPKPTVAIVEACDINENGEVILTTGVGNTPTFVNLADKVIVELNNAHPKALRGMHDLYEPLDPPYRKEIPIYKASDRIGSEVLKIDPKKIVAVVECNKEDEVGGFTAPDEVTQRIGDNVALFLETELKKGTIPAEFLPIQSGVGNIANALLGALGANKNIPPFEMYTEVIQDAVIGLMKEGNVKFASGCSLTISNPVLQDLYSDLKFFKDKLVLRPQELSNNPEVVRRLGLITINTALEADIFGNVNSTHVMGTKMMNGLGGSGDFTRNAYISIYTTPSTAKDGKISSFVPMVSHVDHSEHSVKVMVSEYGIADLRGKSPIQRAQCIIENCVHPMYREMLWDYLKLTQKAAHTPHTLQAAFGMHLEFMESGDMSKTDWSKFCK